MSGAEETRTQAETRFLRCLIAVALLTGAALFAFFRLYSSFAPYDDEGYVQLSLQTYRSGEPLYDRVGTQYGPAFFTVQDAVHTLTGLPVTHDVARLKTLLAWLAACVLAADTLRRLTGRWTLAALAGAAVLFHLDRFGWEPGHPQELAALLILACVWLAALFSPSASLLPCPSASANSLTSTTQFTLPLLLGLATGTLAMIKLNLGVLAGLAGFGSLVLSLPHGRARTWLWWVTALAGAALPLALARGHALTLVGCGLPLAVVAGWIVMSLGAADARDDSSRLNASLGALVTYTAGSVGAVSLFSGLALLGGTSWSGMWHGLVSQHRGFLDLFYHDPPLPVWTPVVAVTAVWVAWQARCDRQLVARLQWLAPLLLVIVGLNVFAQSWTPIRHGLHDRGGAGLLAACVSPLAGLLLLGPTPHASLTPVHVVTRRLLALLALTQPLGAYPTPGTQLAVGTLPRSGAVRRHWRLDDAVGDGWPPRTQPGSPTRRRSGSVVGLHPAGP